MLTEPGTASSRFPLLDAWSVRGREFLSVEVAIMGGAMTWVSEANLVAAISRAGGFGVIACGSMSPDLLREQISQTRARTDGSFGVNLIVMHPQLAELARVCVEERVSHVVLAGGLPKSELIDWLRGNGTKVVCFAPSLGVARRLVRQRVDALVIEGSEAGGHVGPVSTSVLAQEILPHMSDVPIFVAGGIGHGNAVAAYLGMGAAGVQIGTMFVCAEECIAHADFKRAFVRASARDAVTSVQLDPEFKVIPVRAIANKATQRFAETQREVIESFRRGDASYEDASLAIEHFWAGALRRAVIDGDVENGSLMAGQSVGQVTAIRPTHEIVGQVAREAEEALRRAAAPTIAR